MPGGPIQLVAYGLPDMYLTKEPQITFFKMVYRRHTNFSTEMIPQPFLTKPDFGRKSSCVLSRNGDLVSNMYLLIELPSIPAFTNADGTEDKITKVAWTKYIGYAIINTIDVEIGGKLIDRHYGEYLYIWEELTKRSRNRNDELVGNIKLLTDFTNGKNSYTLYVPLKFWFCKTHGLALPLVALQYSEVKVNLNLNDIDKCLRTVPSHYINVRDDILNYDNLEYITQTVDDNVAIGQFIYNDVINKRLYYNRISRDKFLSITTDSTDIDSVVNNNLNQKYLVNGNTNQYKYMPEVNVSEKVHTHSKLVNISLRRCFLLVNYVYLDSEERLKFSKAKHEFLIDQVTLLNEKTISGQNTTLNIPLNHPTKMLVWVSQLSYLKDSNNNDFFNYTDSYAPGGKNLIDKTTILLNGNERLSFRSSNYFNWVQPNQSFSNSPQEGINVYSFCLNPEEHQPSGSCNMSIIDNISLQMTMKSIINFRNDAKFRGYSVNYNVLKIAYGLSALVFSN